MKQEEKDLLLKDLCVRLPYEVMIECSIETGTVFMDVVLQPSHITELIDDLIIIKPYLRPMSSMTEEEKDTYDTLIMCNAPWVVNDWLNKNMFDYRGLISMGLALVALEGMYNLN